MIAKLSGKTAPPTPCSARAADQRPDVPANDAPTQPAKKTERLISSSRSLPYWSPSLPSSGVATAEVSRKRGEEPGRPGRRRVQVALEHRQRRDDHRLLERVGDAGEREDGERDVVVRALARVAHCSVRGMLRSRASPLRSSSTTCSRARSSPTSAPSRRARRAPPRCPTGSTRACARRSRHGSHRALQPPGRGLGRGARAAST